VHFLLFLLQVIDCMRVYNALTKPTYVLAFMFAFWA
jgi:hypothetical protein